MVDDSIIHALGQQWTYLEHLGLVNCPNVSNAGLIKGISRLPLIRSLDVSYCKGITVEGIQRIINMYQDRWDIAEIVREELQTGYDRNGDPANPTEREKLLLQLIKPFQLKLMFSGVEVDKLDYRKDLVKVETSRSRQVYTSIYGGNVEEILTGRVFNPISLQLRTSWTNRPPTSMSTSDTSGSHVDLSLPPKRKADEKASGLSVKKARVECVLAKSTTDISS